MQSKKRIGFIGVGSMGQCAHLANYITNPECEVVALTEVREELAELVGTRYGIPHVYADYKKMIESENLDGIVASMHYSLHGSLLLDLYSYKIPILTEKPISNSVEMAEKMVAAHEKTGTPHYIAYHKRSDVATMFLHQKIQAYRKSDEWGAVKYIRILMPAGDWIAEGFASLLSTTEQLPDLKPDPLPQDMDPDQQKQYDEFVNYYIHQVNLMGHLLGESYSVSYADPSGILMAIQSKSGIPGTIEMSPYRTTVDWNEQVLVAFEKGYFELQLSAPLAKNRPGKIVEYSDPGEGVLPMQIIPQLPWIDAMRNQASNFIRALCGEPTSLCEPIEALENLKIARDYIKKRNM
jgi:predicted dehydrogenase